METQKEKKEKLLKVPIINRYTISQTETPSQIYTLQHKLQNITLWGRAAGATEGDWDIKELARRLI